ncbi:hypothetical protein KIPB_000353 [Kipferlia bialata]|uniref:Suppressor of forked domain-containing protein n=1 Tax=Kipferlia bialata TaxID=797122 RepID=A0A9K3GEW6_9EUKA|nr:hypothetical protein KIPB_000353 [Kipferlia bialata]|eukprot:g353.t1
MAVPSRPPVAAPADTWFQYLNKVAKETDYYQYIATEYEAFFAIHPQCYFFHVILAQKAHKARGVDAALAVFDRAVRMSPFDSALWQEYVKYAGEHRPCLKTDLLRRALGRVVDIFLLYRCPPSPLSPVCVSLE